MDMITEFVKAIGRFSQIQCTKSSLYNKAVEMGQYAKIMVVGCSDSLVDPLSLMEAKLGELFVHRNIAGLVPPYQDEEKGNYSSTSAALEYGVTRLEVTDLIVLGHGLCGGIAALLEDDFPQMPKSFIKSWMKIASEAREKVLTENQECTVLEKRHLCEQESIKISLKNLETYPWIKEKMDKNKLAVHGWYFDRGNFSIYNAQAKTFKVVDFSKFQ